MYLILRYQIVRRLCNLSVHFNPINFGNDKMLRQFHFIGLQVCDGLKGCTHRATGALRL